ncbi:mycofactocin-coupled SDR family oxidoreductase [Nocardia sp. XZ_19_231]|uniref:mycofactocin-coupled SDR family oxidoreductase n=1 Tax=Nocardia sp. XZ_19_231 TaxID=2769252 RepID=UPI00188DF840|nr:mycofactocin-coupled SDR family oxidoreductase [Nocardia sp. XZ_19_231]
MTEGRVAGKVAFITGAARGQGRSHAVRLAEEGADIIAFDLCGDVDTVPYPMPTPADLQVTIGAVEQTGRRIVSVQGDVRDPAALAKAVKLGVEQLGGLDIVVANAGITSFSPAVEMSAAMWADMIDINLTGVWNTCQAALPQLLAAGRGGSIIVISSSAGIRSSPNIAHYSAAKHGLRGMMMSLAQELAPHFIRVNTVHPTTVSTDMVRNDAMYALFRPDLESPELDDAIPAFTSLNLLPIPWVEPRDISNAVLFLASDESRYITSAALPVDAGSSHR